MFSFCICFILLSCIAWFIPMTALKNGAFLLGFWIKFLFGCSFVWVYSNYYGAGMLTADPADFMKDSLILQKVSEHSLLDYFRLLIGFYPKELIQHYLQETHHWDAGNLILLNDNQNVLRVNSLICFFSKGNIYHHILFFSWISTFGFKLVYSWLVQISAIRPIYCWVLLCSLPSIAFWSDSMLKEPLMMLGFCFFLVGVFDLNRSFFNRTVFVLIGLLLQFMFKPYVGFFSSLILFIQLIHSFLKYRPVLIFGVLIASGFIFLRLNKTFSDGIIHYLTRKQFDFVNVGRGGLHVYSEKKHIFYYFEPNQYNDLKKDGRDNVSLLRMLKCKMLLPGRVSPFKDVLLYPNGEKWKVYYESPYCSSYISLEPINHSYLSLIKSVPSAFSNVLFRPVFGDPGGNLKYFALIETILLMLVVFRTFFLKWNELSREDKNRIELILLFIFCLALLIGWITPVLGAIVRYRIPIYFALLCCLFLMNKKIEVRDKYE